MHIAQAGFIALIPQQEILWKVGFLYSHGMEMVWEAQSFISAHTEREISMQQGFLYNHIILEAPSTLF